MTLASVVAFAAARSAIALYEKCLDCSRQSGDVQGEGETQHRLGLILASIGEVDRAMQSQRTYRDNCASQVRFHKQPPAASLPLQSPS